MTLRVIGAGVGRTGTESLKLALERLLGGRCYHMMEVFGRPEDIPVWLSAARGQDPDWVNFLREFTAAVDWPASAYWRQLSEAFPEALVLLSLRADADTWWASASKTIFSDTVIRYRKESPLAPGWPHDLLAAWFTPGWQREDAAKAAYLRH